MDIYKSLNISIGTVIKNTKMLKFVPDHRKHAVKKLPNLLRYVSDKYKTQKCVIKLLILILLQ